MGHINIGVLVVWHPKGPEKGCRGSYGHMGNAKNNKHRRLD